VDGGADGWIDGAPVGSALAATLGEGAGGTALGAIDGRALGCAENPPAAIGICSPPREPTKVMATAAQATTNSADASTAGVSVRRTGGATGPSTNLLDLG